MTPRSHRFAAVVLAGGRGSRLGGADKGSIEVGGRTLLARTLDALVDAEDVVVVGEPVPTERPVTFVVEDPRFGGPVAAVGTGLEALRPGARDVDAVVVVPVDMPFLVASTVRRLRDAVTPDADGAVLVDPTGRRQPVLAVEADRLRAVVPGREERHGLPLRAVVGRLTLVEVPAVGDEARDVDTWLDLRAIGEAIGSCQPPPDPSTLGP